MNVNALSNAQLNVASTPNSSQSTPSSLWGKLGKSLKSGDLAGAQADFATLKQDYEQNHSVPPSGPLATDIKQLSQALNAGNLGAAQSAFATLAQDAKSQGVYSAGTSSSASVSSSTDSGSLSVLA